MENRKVIISIAPVSHPGKPVPGECRNPVRAADIAEEVINCASAGASMVHLHVRDENGQQTFDLEVFRKTLDLFTVKTDIVIQGSTGGMADLSLEERCVCLDEPRVEVASLNMGSVNFGEEVYINTLPDIRFWAGRMKERKVLPELECFDLSMIETSRLMEQGNVLEAPLHFNFCLGYSGALSAKPENIGILRSAVGAGSHWGLTHDCMADQSLLACAVSMGGSVVRTGFEDSWYYAPGKTAASNLQLVEHLVKLIRSLGCEPATPAEARKMLNL